MKIFRYIFDSILLFASASGAVIFSISFYYAVQYWIQNYALIVSSQIEAKMFWIALLMAIIYGEIKFIELCVKGFSETVKNFGGKKNE